MSLPLCWLPKQNKKIKKELCSLSLVLVCKTCFCLRTHTHTHFALFCCQPNSQHSLSLLLSYKTKLTCQFAYHQPVFSASFALSQLLLLRFVVVRFSFCVCRAALFSCALSVAAVCCWLVRLTCLLVFVFAFALCFVFARRARCFVIVVADVRYTRTGTHTHTSTSSPCARYMYVNMR